MRRDPAALRAGLAVAPLLAVTLLTGATSRVDGDPLAVTVIASIGGLVYVVAGLVASRERADRGVGGLLMAGGVAWFLFGTFWSSNDDWVQTIGSVLGSIPVVLILMLVSLYPNGRPVTVWERRFVGGIFAIALAAGLLPALFAATVETDGCTVCHANRIMVVDSPDTADALQAAFTVVGAIVFLAVAAVLARRWRAATPAYRRVLAPVYLTAGAAVLAIGLGFGTSSTAAGGVFWGIAVVGVFSLPFAMLLGMARSRLMPGARDLFRHADDPAGPAAVAAVRRALRDPLARVGLWIEDAGAYVDGRGDPLPTEPGPGRMVAPIRSAGGDPLAVLDHDAAVAGHEPRLLAEVVSALRMAIETDLRRHLLRVSEARSRALLDAIPDLMFRIRRDGCYLAVRGDPQLLLAPADALVGRSVADVLPASEAAIFLDGVERALQTGELQTRGYELDVGGALRSFEARWVPSGADEVTVIVRDFTDRVRLERELAARLAELTVQRARIVEAQDEERRRLERNLHDGAQQRLVSLSLALRLARSRLADPDAAAAILDGACEELALALSELRELARGIHPAVLTERGLAAAVESLTDRSPVPVELVAFPAHRLPQPVEVAAFYVIAESLANVAKYASASYARVSVIRANGAAVVEVEDDGVGGADPVSGSGLRGLIDRVEALDGHLSIDSERGRGTRLRAEIPVA